MGAADRAAARILDEMLVELSEARADLDKATVAIARNDHLLIEQEGIYDRARNLIHDFKVKGSRLQTDSDAAWRRYRAAVIACEREGIDLIGEEA